MLLLHQEKIEMVEKYYQVLEASTWSAREYFHIEVTWANIKKCNYEIFIDDCLNIFKAYNIKLENLRDLFRNSRWVISPSWFTSQSHLNYWPDSEEQEIYGQHLNSPFFLETLNTHILQRDSAPLCLKDNSTEDYKMHTSKMVSTKKSKYCIYRN